MYNDSITPTNKSVKSKQDYIILADAWIEDALGIIDNDTIQNFYLHLAQVNATLAIAAPDEAAPDDYLTACRERDEMKRQRDELLAACKRAVGFFAIDAPMDFDDAEAECEKVNELCRTAILNAEQTAEPDAAE